MYAPKGGVERCLVHGPWPVVVKWFVAKLACDVPTCGGSLRPPITCHYHPLHFHTKGPRPCPVTQCEGVFAVVRRQSCKLAGVWDRANAKNSRRPRPPTAVADFLAPTATATVRKKIALTATAAVRKKIGPIELDR